MSRAKMAIAEIRELNVGASECEPSKARSVPGGKPGAIDIAAERATLFTQVEQKLSLDLDEEVQYELARWLDRRGHGEGAAAAVAPASEG